MLPTHIIASQAATISPLLFAHVCTVAHTREVCARIDPDKDPYDVALDTYEKGMTSARLDEIFDQVCPQRNACTHPNCPPTQAKAQLIPLLAALRAASPPDDGWLYRKPDEAPFDPEAQAALCKQIAIDLGFDLNNGRLDVSVHPFTGGAHPTGGFVCVLMRPKPIHSPQMCA